MIPGIDHFPRFRRRARRRCGPPPCSSAIVVGCALLVGSAGLHAAEIAAYTTTSEAFAQLTADEQRQWVVDAFRHRMEIARNLHYESQLVIRNVEYADGVPGDVVLEGVRFAHRHWALDDAYRIDTDLFGPPSTRDPVEFVTSGYDRASRRSRGTVRFANDSKMSARIDVNEDPLSFEDRLRYWLDGEHNRLEEYVFKYLLDHSEQWSFSFENEAAGVVRLTVPWMEVTGHGFTGSRVLDLDPERGFFPVHWRNEWEADLPGRLVGWRKEEVFAEEPELVGDVWMPTRLREIHQASTGPAGQANLYETTVTRIEHGTVTPEDLIVPFMGGMRVVDAIQESTYIADADGNPRPETVETVHKRESAATVPRAPTVARGSATTSGSLRYWLILFDVICIGAALVGILVWRRNSRMRSKRW